MQESKVNYSTISRLSIFLSRDISFSLYQKEGYIGIGGYQFGINSSFLLSVSAYTENSRSMTKKDLKNMKMSHEFQVEWQELLFQQKQTRQKQAQEFDKKQQLQEETCNQIIIHYSIFLSISLNIIFYQSFLFLTLPSIFLSHHLYLFCFLAKWEKDQMGHMHLVQWQQLQHQQKMEKLSEQQLQQISLEWLQQQQQLELKHLQEKDEMETSQLGQLQQIEK